MRWWFGIIGLAALLAAEAVLFADHGAVIASVDAVAATAFLAAAVVAAGRPTGRRFAAVAFLACIAWLAGNVVVHLAYVHRPLMAHAALSYPDGRLRGPLAHGVVAAAWVGALLLPVGHSAVATIALGVMLAAAGTGTAVRSAILPRRAAVVGAQAAVVLGAAFAVPSLLRLVSPVSDRAEVVMIGHAALVAVGGTVLVISLLLRSGTAAGVVDDVVELSEVETSRLDAVMASLRQGSPNATATNGGDPEVSSVLAAATELLDANARLHQDLSDQVDEVRRSRRRLVEVSDVERRRLSRRLTDGTERHLDELEGTLRRLGGVLEGDSAVLTLRAVGEVDSIRDDLARLGQGLHPRLLAESGLLESLHDLTRSSGVPTEVCAPDARFPEAIEAAVWYVCAEAVANVGKHAHARTTVIDVVADEHELVATVTDDGVGGARAEVGGGLAGLADRLDAIGGGLELRERPGGGTQVRARIPLP